MSSRCKTVPCAETWDTYLGGIEVPKLSCASPHGFPSTSARCALQTRLTTNGHLATYFAARGHRCASQSRFSGMGSNSGPRLLFSIEAPTVSAMPMRTDVLATLDSPSSTPCGSEVHGPYRACVKSISRTPILPACVLNSSLGSLCLLPV